MNIAKNMEAIFIAALLIAGATSIATAAVPASKPAVQDSSATMQVVNVSAKRLTAAEKAAL